MKEPEPILLDTILAELDRLGVLGNTPLAGQTVAELAAAWGLPSGRVRSWLHKANRAGILRSARATRPKLGGGVASVPVFWLECPKPAKRR